MKSTLQLQRNLFFLLLFSSLLFSSCITAPQIVPFESILKSHVNIYQENSIRIQHPDIRVVASSAELEPLNKLIFQWEYRENTVPLYQTNFSTHILIIVFQGDKNSGGFEIKVQRIQRSGAQVDVYATFFSPKPSDLAAIGGTSPYHIVRVQRADMPSTGEMTFVLLDEASGKGIARVRYTNR